MKKREKIYIMPTEYGLMYGAGILVSLLGGAIYNNNLAFLLCFFLMALFLIGMVQTHNNIKKLDVEKIVVFLSPSESVGHGVIWFKSHSEEGHHQLRLRAKSGEDLLDSNISNIYKKSLHPHYFDFKTGTWGKKELKKIKLSTRYPFGFFYAWRLYPVSVEYFVYPQPSGVLKLESGEFNGFNKGAQLQNNGDDFTEHKKYVVGDSQKHIDWKAYARGRPLMTKKFNEGDRQTFLIDFDKTPGNLERKARQASQWIHRCEEEQNSYSFRFGTKLIPASQGPRHKMTCLRILASMRDVK